MSPELDPEEAEALADLSSPTSPASAARGGRGGAIDVQPRDFARPIRLSPKELSQAEVAVRRALPDARIALARALRSSHALELVDASEVNSDGLFDQLAAPLAVMRFEVAGQPGWLVWEVLPALAAVEVALGAGEPGFADERAFSTVERNVLVRMAGPLIGAVASALGLEAERFSVPRIPEEIGSWRDGGEHADRRRLLLQLAFEGPGAESTMRIYLPGVEPRAAGAEHPTAALPHHLEQVKVDLAARLGANDIPLAELLSLEPGDVIPLSTPADEPLRVYMEDQLRASAVLGSKNGRLAIRIVEVGPKDEDV